MSWAPYTPNPLHLPVARRAQKQSAFTPTSFGRSRLHRIPGRGIPSPFPSSFPVFQPQPYAAAFQPFFGEGVTAVTISTTTTTVHSPDATMGRPRVFSCPDRIEREQPKQMELERSGSSEGSPHFDPIRKEWVCDFNGCTQVFKTRFALKRHFLRHVGSRPFQCPHPGCTRSFAESAGLKRHKRVHTGERPYVCGVEGCGRAFGDATNAKRHELTHCGVKPFHCLLGDCGRKYSRKTSLRNHLLSFHRVGPNTPQLRELLANCRREEVSKERDYVKLASHSTVGSTPDVTLGSDSDSEK